MVEGGQENYRKWVAWESRRNGATHKCMDRLETGSSERRREVHTDTGRNEAGTSASQGQWCCKAVSWQTGTMSPPQGPRSLTEPLSALWQELNLSGASASSFKEMMIQQHKL